MTTDVQPCGHDVSHRQPAAGGGTWCDACLPDDSIETYVKQNVAQFTVPHGCYAAASVPPGLGGKIAMTPFPSAEEAQKFVDEKLVHEAWVVGPEGEITYHAEDRS